MDNLNGGFAYPHYEGLLGAVRIYAEYPFCILLCIRKGDKINWQAVAEMQKDLSRVTTADLLISDIGGVPSAYVYRGCDYAVGAIMGLLEQAAKKRLPLPF
jgi:hypothetical protein